MAMDGQNMSAEQIFDSVADDGAGAHGEQPAPQEQPAEQTAEPAPEGPQYLDLGQFSGHHVKYTANGKEVSEPVEMALKRASMGYNYAQNVEKLKGQETENVTIREQNAALQKWQKYDEYAKQNPKWAEHVQNNWDNRGQAPAGVEGLDPNDPVMQHIQKLQTTVDNFSTQYGEKMDTVDQLVTSQQNAKEDLEFNSEIDSVREKFGKMLDFDTPDEQGETVEYKVMAHMRDNNIPNFHAAFTNLYMDQLLTANSTQALEQQAKTKQAQMKKGIIGVSPTSQASAPASPAQKPRDWNDAAAAALAEWN